MILAIDVGTSACKAAIFQTDGGLLASASRAYPVYRPRTGWAEQDPDEWWRAVAQAVRACLEEAHLSGADIEAVGIDGQSWSCIPVDGNGRALSRTPIWMDTRAADICARERERLGDELFRVSGNPFQPTYTTGKILYLRECEPELYARARYFLQSNAYIVLRLTGEVTQDESQGYGLHVFDIRARRYDEALCEKLGIDPRTLPPVSPCSRVVGGVTREAARETGLREGTRVVAGGLDAACGTLGAGVYLDGQTQEQGGQAGGMSVCLPEAAADPALILSTHVVPDKWLLQGGTVGGGGSLKWFAAELGESETRAEREGGANRFDALCELAERVPAGSEGLVFLPYLAGERSPIWDADACGVYFGLDYAKTRAHMARALLEGAAFALRHNIDTARRAGVDVGALYAMGGAANSVLWTQIKSDVTGLEILVPDADAATVRGAAMLAGVGAGLYRDFDEAVACHVHLKRTHAPDLRTRAVYDARYGVYLELYERLAPLMKRAAHIGI